MSKSKTIAEQIDLLQSENEHLKELNKLFEKAIKLEFDMEAKKNIKSSKTGMILTNIGIKSADILG